MSYCVYLGEEKMEIDVTNKSDINRLINNMMLYYLRSFPFFVNMLLTMADIMPVAKEYEEKALAYTYFNYENERIKICINWKMVEKYNFTIEELMFVILHEYLHNYFYHFTRMAEEHEINIELANYVEDYYCNELLMGMLKVSYSGFEDKGITMVNYSVLKQIANGESLPFKNFDDSPTEPVLFKWFMENCENKAKSMSEKSEKNGEKNIDDHEISEKEGQKSAEKYNEAKGNDNEGSAVTKKELDRIMEAVISNKENEVKNNINSASNMEEDAIRRKEKILKKDDFLNLLDLKRIISKEIEAAYVKNYKRMSRKRQSTSIVYKGKIKEHGKKILVAVDVSGSISDEDLTKCYEMLNGFLDKNKNSTALDVVYWSSCEITDKHFHKNIKNIKDLIKFKVHSSGGTEINYLHNWIKEYYKNQYIGVINITDGYFYSESNIPKEVVQYNFVLTEKNMEKQILDSYKDKRVKVNTIKKSH